MSTLNATYWRDTGTLEIVEGDDVITEVSCDEATARIALKVSIGMLADSTPIEYWDNPAQWLASR